MSTAHFRPSYSPGLKPSLCVAVFITLPHPILNLTAVKWDRASMIQSYQDQENPSVSLYLCSFTVVCSMITLSPRLTQMQISRGNHGKQGTWRN